MQVKIEKYFYPNLIIHPVYTRKFTFLSRDHLCEV